MIAIAAAAGMTHYDALAVIRESPAIIEFRKKIVGDGTQRAVGVILAVVVVGVHLGRGIAVFGMGAESSSFPTMGITVFVLVVVVVVVGVPIIVIVIVIGVFVEVGQ